MTGAAELLGDRGRAGVDAHVDALAGLPRPLGGRHDVVDLRGEPGGVSPAAHSVTSIAGMSRRPESCRTDRTVRTRTHDDPPRRRVAGTETSLTRSGGSVVSGQDGGHDPAVLTAEQRAWLRAMRAELRRRQLDEAQPHSHRCSGCDGRLSERTRGCKACRSRHAARRRQLRMFFAEGRLPDPARARGGLARWNGAG